MLRPHFHCLHHKRLILFVILSTALHATLIGFPIHSAQPVSNEQSWDTLTVFLSERPIPTEAGTVPNKPPLPSPLLNYHRSTPTSPIIPTPIYYEINDIDKPIKPITPIDPHYPESAITSIAGTITLDLYLDETGEVQSVAIRESSLPLEFNNAAIGTFLHRRFEPGTVRGEPVKIHLSVKLEYVPGND